MTTTNLKNEASAPASVRPSSVSKTRAFAAHRANRELPTRTVLGLLKAQLPTQYELAEIVGRWIGWIFPSAPIVPPPTSVGVWVFIGINAVACGSTLAVLAPRTTVIPATRAANMVRVLPKFSTPEMFMNTTSFFPGINTLVKPFQFPSIPYEYKVTPLRECPTPDDLMICDTPAKAAEYWRMHIADHPYFNPECECFVALMLNTRRRVKGHYLVSIGTMDTILVHPREVFRLALIASAASVVLMHNHPSGDPTPSGADIKVTRDLIRAGQLLKIEVVDHVVIGSPKYASLRELGYFAL